MSKKGVVGNNKEMRGVSNWLDEKLGWDEGYKEKSGTRGFIHGVWHTGAGVVQYVQGNNENADAEWKQAGAQFKKGGKD